MIYTRTILTKLDEQRLSVEFVHDWKLNLLESSSQTNQLFLAVDRKVQVITNEKHYFLEPASKSEINQIKIGQLGSKEILVTVDDVGCIMIYYTLEKLKPLELSHSGVSTWGVAICRSMIAVSDNSFKIHIWNLDQTILENDHQFHDNVKTLSGHRHNIPAIDFTEDGTRMVSCSIDGTVRLWEVKTGNTLQIVIASMSWKWGCVNINLNEFLFIDEKQNRNLWRDLNDPERHGDLYGLKPEVLFEEVLMNTAFSNPETRIRAGSRAQLQREKKIVVKEKGYETASSFGSVCSTSEDVNTEEESFDSPNDLLSNEKESNLGEDPEEIGTVSSEEQEMIVDSLNGDEFEEEEMIVNSSNGDEFENNSSVGTQAMVYEESRFEQFRYNDSLPNSDIDDTEDDAPARHSQSIFGAPLPESGNIVVYGSQSDLFVAPQALLEPILFLSAVDGVNGPLYGRSGIERVCFLKWLPEIATLVAGTQVGRISIVRLVRSETRIGMVLDYVIYPNDGNHIIGLATKRLPSDEPVYQIDILSRSGILQTYQLTTNDGF